MALWTPARTTTALWLDAADAGTLYDATSGGSLVAADGAIARWEDKSGNSRHCTQGTSGSRPIRKTSIQNGRDVARGDGSRWMSIPSSTAMFNNFHSGQAFAACVVRAGDSADPNALYGLFGNAGGFFASRAGFALVWDDRTSIPASNRAGATFWRDNVEVVARQNNNFAPNTFGILSAAYDVQNATVANKVTLKINGGATINTAAGTYSATAQANASINFRVFDYGPDVFLVGDIAEVVLVNSLPSAADQDRFQGYLAHKWGLAGSLPNDHPYKTNAPKYGLGGIAAVIAEMI
jgi:hypothetical protein